jgi:hypothetical protein
MSVVFVSWMQSTKSRPDLITVQGYCTEKKISIPMEQQFHFENHLALLRDIGSDDEYIEIKKCALLVEFI